MVASPRTREKIISGVSGSIARKGLGLGTGPVGNPLGYLGRPGTRGLLALCACPKNRAQILQRIRSATDLLGCSSAGRTEPLMKKQSA